MIDLKWLSTKSEYAFREYEFECECSDNTWLLQEELEEQDYRPICSDCNSKLQLVEE